MHFPHDQPLMPFQSQRAARRWRRSTTCPAPTRRRGRAAHAAGERADTPRLRGGRRRSCRISAEHRDHSNGILPALPPRRAKPVLYLGRLEPRRLATGDRPPRCRRRGTAVWIAGDRRCVAISAAATTRGVARPFSAGERRREMVAAQARLAGRRAIARRRASASCCSKRWPPARRRSRPTTRYRDVRRRADELNFPAGTRPRSRATVEAHERRCAARCARAWGEARAIDEYSSRSVSSGLRGAINAHRRDRAQRLPYAVAFDPGAV